MSTTNFAFSIWLLFFVLLSIPGSFEQFKLKLFLGLSILNTAVVAIKLLVRTKKNIRTKLNHLSLLFSAWIIILFAASLKEAGLEKALLGGSYRQQGLLFFLGLLILCTCYRLKIYETKGRIFYSTIRILFIIQVAVLISELLLTAHTRPAGTIGEANAAAGFLLMSIPLVLENTKSAKLRYLYTVLGLIGVIATKSRSVTLFYMIISTFMLIGKINTKGKKLLITAVLPLIASISIFLATNLFNRVDNINRVNIWKWSLEFIKERPFWGYGVETQEGLFRYVLSQNHISTYGLIIDRAHNLFLDVLIWTGTFGLIPFLIWMGLETRRKVVAKEKYRVWGVIGFLLFSSLHPLSVVHWVLLIVLLS